MFKLSKKTAVLSNQLRSAQRTRIMQSFSISLDSVQPGHDAALVEQVIAIVRPAPRYDVASLIRHETYAALGFMLVTHYT
mmetsp:Transcript_29133/g.64238  ORF Transcript_29133/g.64238 Transcript_29133/m.64238 type:complete len:80 (+) Transcript_29133:102-341(+)